jgi:hypothetical protein
MVAIVMAIQPHFRGVVILLGGSLRAVARYAATVTLAAHTNIKHGLCVDCLALTRRDFTPWPQASDIAFATLQSATFRGGSLVLSPDTESLSLQPIPR